MAESADVSIEVHLADNKLVKVEHHTSFSETDSGNSIQLATKSVSIDNHDYLRIISDELISGDMVTAANDGECDVTDHDTHSQQQQYQESNFSTRADKHIYVTVIADSEDNIASEVRVVNKTYEDQPALSWTCMPNIQHTESDLSPIYTHKEQQTMFSDVYLEPNNVDTDPNPDSVYTDPDPDSVNTTPEPNSVYTDPNPDMVYSDLIDYNTEAPLESSNMRRRRIVASLVILGGLLITGVVIRIIVNFVPHTTVNKQMSSGICYFYPCAFQLYHDGPIVQVRPTRSVITFNRNLIADTDAHHPSSGSGIFRAPRTGLYWFHFDIYTDRKGRANYSLVGRYNNKRLTQLSSQCPKYNMPTLSRVDLRSLNETDQLYTTSTYAAYASLNDTYAIAWSGFEMREVLGAMPVAFSVVNSSLRSMGRIMLKQFSRVLVNTNSSWDMANSAFIAPVDGVYVLSVSHTAPIGLSGKMEIVKLMLGTPYAIYPLILKEILYAAIGPVFPCNTTFSFTMVIRLTQNQYVQVHNLVYDSNIDYSWDSFKGFLYAPLAARHNVIWSLDARIDRKSAFSIYMHFAPSNSSSQLQFTGVNETHLLIPISGIYYVTLTAQFCELPSSCCTVGLFANDKMLFKTTPKRFDLSECFLHSRAVLLPLQYNDTLSVIRLEGIMYTVTARNWINFSGFLVHAR